MKGKIIYIINFLRDSKSELNRVKWPDRKEVMITTGAVLIFSFLIAFMLGLFDYIYGLIVKLFF